ncbi:MAG: phosphoserine [Methylocystaceae bacterium]|nr:MAG: phosphoserine [Methylocystaceae bacterium]
MAAVDKVAKPNAKPANPSFSSGPCAKRPGWALANLAGAALGRSHRSKAGKEKLAQAIALTREILRVPADYRIGIVPASDTGAVEIALWSLLGPRGVDVVAWESFSKDWVNDVLNQLKIEKARSLAAPYGELPDLTQIDFDNDVVFAWNGTTSGPLDFAKLDVTTYSWQKVLGGEAAHGMLILSPRAVERLESYAPPWPMPKIFRLTNKGKLNEGIFQGETINTPSLLAVEDYLDALSWAQSIGGLEPLFARSNANAQAIGDWVERTPWIDFLAKDPATRSNTSVCLIFSAASAAKDADAQATLAKKMAAMIESEAAGYDFGAYRDAPPGFRIWCGATVEASDVARLTEWLDWAYAQACADAAQAG